MPLTEQQVEQEIKDKKLNAPRIHPERIDQLMAGVTFKTHVVEGTTTTVAVAVMSNGFTLTTGISACASPENFNQELGAKIAIDDATKKARDELWRLEGYRLKMTLSHDDGFTDQSN